MTAPRTSIALATYNGARFLPVQLESYLKQTRLPDELVVSDDGSTDATGDILREFAGTAPFPVIVLKNPGSRGITQNFENAIRHTINDIVLLSDQDDQWLPNHVAGLADMLESNSRILCVSSNSLIVDDSLQSKGYSLEQSQRYAKGLYRQVMRLPADQLELVARHRIVAGHGMAFRRKLLPILLPLSEHCLFDWWIYLTSAAFGAVAYIPEPLTLYRTHTAQTMGGKKQAMVAVADKLSKTSATADEAPRWHDLLDRLRLFPDAAENFTYSERVLQQKLAFTLQRTRNRKRSVPGRFLSTTAELIRGRYHRLGRGVKAYGRDLYGNQ